jgi:hypothetical protein
MIPSLYLVEKCAWLSVISAYEYQEKKPLPWVRRAFHDIIGDP